MPIPPSTRPIEALRSMSPMWTLDGVVTRTPISTEPRQPAPPPGVVVGESVEGQAYAQPGHGQDYEGLESHGAHPHHRLEEVEGVGGGQELGEGVDRLREDGGGVVHAREEDQYIRKEEGHGEGVLLEDVYEAQADHPQD